MDNLTISYNMQKCEMGSVGLDFSYESLHFTD